MAREAISKIPLMKLVARMINIRPDDRLSTSDVLSGPGFNNFNPLRDICQQIKNRNFRIDNWTLDFEIHFQQGLKIQISLKKSSYWVNWIILNCLIQAALSKSVFLSKYFSKIPILSLPEIKATGSPDIPRTGDGFFNLDRCLLGSGPN